MIRFDRNEWAGALGDLGTDLPLLVGVMVAAQLDPAGVLVVFGAMQIFTALRYGIPMPVQPLKAMAALVIAQKISGPVLNGAGLAIGVCMLGLTAFGAIDWLVKVMPRCVIRGVQLGLGLKLGSLALKDYIRSDGIAGYMLAAGIFVLVLSLRGNRRFPAALLAVGAGALYALAFKTDVSPLLGGVSVHAPAFHVPAWGDIATGFVLLTLPQLPLSLGNSVLATRQIAEDYFPEKRITARRIGWTYSLMNLIAPFFGGVPVCHGSGGMAGHCAFGARTGGSVFLYGSAFLIVGVFFSRSFTAVAQVFPLPVLGVLLLFEALSLVLLIGDVAEFKQEFPVTILTGLVAAFLPFGFGIGLLLGSVIFYTVRRSDSSLALCGLTHMIKPVPPAASAGK